MFFSLAHSHFFCIVQWVLRVYKKDADIHGLTEYLGKIRRKCGTCTSCNGAMRTGVHGTRYVCGDDRLQLFAMVTLAGFSYFCSIFQSDYTHSWVVRINDIKNCFHCYFFSVSSFEYFGAWIIILVYHSKNVVSIFCGKIIENQIFVVQWHECFFHHLHVIVLIKTFITTIYDILYQFFQEKKIIKSKIHP